MATIPKAINETTATTLYCAKGAAAIVATITEIDPDWTYAVKDVGNTSGFFAVTVTDENGDFIGYLVN